MAKSTQRRDSLLVLEPATVVTYPAAAWSAAGSESYGPDVAIDSAFLCYVHADDEHDLGRILQLATDVQNEFAAITGEP